MSYDINNAKKDLKSMTVLFRAQQAITEVVKEDVKKYELNISEFSVLEVLFHQKQMTVQGVCEKTLMPNSSMTYVLDKLVKKKLVERVQDQNDKRRYMVKLSNEGLKKANEIFPIHYQVMQEVFSVLSDEEQAIFQVLLKKVGYYAKKKVGEQP